jgi:uncharacterized protein YdaU (DUF1376 family)
MAQHRDAPAFQEYAASMMARTAYRVLSLEGRGLLYSMRLECWVNGSLPGDPAVLARVLGFAAERVAQVLPELESFFVSDDNGALRCPELDDYRGHLEERRSKQSQGGKAGAAKTNAVRGGAPPARPTGKPQAARESLVKQSPVQSSKTKSLEGKPSDDAWLSDYERASRGH